MKKRSFLEKREKRIGACGKTAVAEDLPQESSKREQEGVKGSIIAARALLLFLVIIGALFVFAAPAEAGGVPSKIVVFTDKKVYQAWWDDTVSSQNHDSDFAGYDPDFGDVYVYAIVLDDDGKIMKNVPITGTLNDTVEYDHREKGNDAIHHANLSDPNLYDRNLIFNDTGTSGDGQAGDGIYTAKTTLDKNALGLSLGNTREENHIKLRVYANYTAGGLSGYSEALISFVQCMNGIATNAMQGTHTGAGDTIDNCPVCHVGYEHSYENISGTFADDQLDIHALKWNAPDTSICDKGYDAYVWNGTYLGPNQNGCVKTAKQIVPGSQYCYACHTNGTALYDYGSTNTNTGATTRNDLNDRPSCSRATCHNNGTTRIEGAPIIPWAQAGALLGQTQNNSNIWKQKAHNHSLTSPANVSCALCHLTTHSFSRPNSSTNTLTYICEKCHNRTDGWLNLSANTSHPKTTDCKNCHKNPATTKLDVHLVPQGVSGGGNCTECHNAGNSPPATGALVNFSAMNDSLALHKNLNKDDTSNVSRPAENRKCWACHGNGSDPGDGHPTNYKTPYNCVDCHVPVSGQNLNFTPKAILNVTQHYWNGTNITTSAATSCYACHNKSEMMLGSFDPDGAASVYGGANGGNNSSSHYGRKRADIRTWDSGRAANCSYCHQNSSTAFASAMLNAGYNSSIKNHSLSNSPSCTNSTCHNSSWLHNSTLTIPSFNVTNTSSLCQNCHATKQKHNGTQDCNKCHINQSSNDTIHPIKYIQTNGTYSQTNASAANCTNCHQSILSSNFSTAPQLPDPIKHSSNSSNGSIWGTYWNTSQSPSSSCYYCHNNTKHNSTALGRVSVLLTDGNNSRNGSLTTTTWCADCHYNTSNINYKGSQWPTSPPLITVNNTGKSNWENHTNYVKSGYKDSVCEGCHALNGTYLSTSLNYSHSLDTGVTGGPDCISCHYIGSGNHNINITALNLSVHYGVNSVNSTSNGACWACHDSKGNVTSGMGDRYDTPYNCTSCHLASGEKSGAYGARLVTNHYKSGTNLTARSSSASDLNSCIDCHENISAMLIPNSDPDTGSFAGDGINITGGASSFYHYGKNRTSFGTTAGSTVYCTYCHNSSGEFSGVFLDSANSSIQNHSSYPSTPGCNYCHNSTGAMLHDTPIVKPSFTLDSSTYCLSCHGNNGTGSTNYSGSVTGVKDRHNSSVNCTNCHINSTRSIHPVRYLNPDGSNFSESKTNAINCTNCHQTKLNNFSTAPQVPDPLKHSSNLTNGSIWGTYWNTSQSPSSSCYYCHNDTKHNSTALGRVSVLLTDGNNSRNGSLTTTTWCADCHYNTSNSNYKGSQWPTSPPLITVNNTGKSNWENHTSYLSSGYKDSNCNSCHALNVTTASYASTSLNYSHSLDAGAAGGPNCISCHNLATGLGGGAPVGINFTAFNQSTHFGMNAINSSANGACWACHDSDGNVTSGHGDRQKTPKICDECHLGTTGTFNNSAYNAIFVWEHYYNGEELQAGNSSSNLASCINCHENVTEMIVYNNDTDTGGFTGDGIRLNGGNRSSYHYSKPRTDMRVGSGLRESNCLYCHQNTSTAFQNAMQNPVISKYIQNHTDNPAQKCTTCHVANQWIHNKSLTIPNTGIVNNDYCSSCHAAGAGGTRAIPETHNDLGVNCWACHQDPNTTVNPMYNTPIHGMMYALSNGSYLRHSDNNTPANCTTCHVYNLVNTSPTTAVRIPELNHSTDMYAGNKWGNYWDNNSMKTACYFCHQSEPHNQNSLLLGNISNIKGSNQYKSSNLATSRWCSACHYNDSTSNYQGSVLSPVPPEILNKTGTVPGTANDGTSFYNHSTDVATGSNDSKCKECHGSALSAYSETTLNFSHAVGEGGGGPDCVSSGCHGTTGSSTSPYMNWTSLKTGMHAGLNSGAANTTSLTDPIDKACWACHGDGTQPSGHPSNYRQPYNCTACHLASGIITGTYQAKNVTEHQHVDGQILTNSSYARCENCHNNSLVTYLDNETGALTNYTTGNVSHYGSNKTAGKLMEPSVNSTNCVYCHLNNSNRQKWANATNATATKPDIHGTFNDTTASSICWSCHVDGGASGVTAGFTLHNVSLNPGASEFCLTCHVTGGSAQNLNVTGARMGAHITLNNTPANTLNNSDCWSCHFGYPNGTAGSHSYNVSRQNTYYCGDCHWSNHKNATAESKGIAAKVKNISADYLHGALDCEGCHVANDTRKPGGTRVMIYHNSSAKRNASGVVSNPGWAMINGLYVGCTDCHRVQNTQDAPFRAPGIVHSVSAASTCGSNCHGPSKTDPHAQSYLPCSTLPVLCGTPKSWVSPPTLSNVNLSIPNVSKSGSTVLSAKGQDNYNSIENATYRIVNTSGTVQDWTQMLPVGYPNNKWGPSRTEVIEATISPSSLSPGNYTIELKAMAGGPRTKPGRYYPDNGEWSAVYTITMEVTP